MWTNPCSNAVLYHWWCTTKSTGAWEGSDLPSQLPDFQDFVNVDRCLYVVDACILNRFSISSLSLYLSLFYVWWFILLCSTCCKQPYKTYVNLYPARWNFLQRYHADFLDCKNNWCNQRWPTPGSNPHPSKLESRTSAAPDMFWMTLLNGIEHVHTTNVSKMSMYNTLSITHESFQNINSHHKGLIRHYSSLAYPGHINENPASEGPFGRWESTALSRKVMASQCVLSDAGNKISHLESPRRCIKQNWFAHKMTIFGE